MERAPIRDVSGITSRLLLSSPSLTSILSPSNVQRFSGDHFPASVFSSPWVFRRIFRMNRLTFALWNKSIGRGMRKNCGTKGWRQLARSSNSSRSCSFNPNLWAGLEPSQASFERGISAVNRGSSSLPSIFFVQSLATLSSRWDKTRWT